MRVRVVQLPSLHRELHIQPQRLSPKQTPHCHGSHCCLVSVQQSNTRGLIVISEDQDTRTLLIHEIQSQDIYQRQGGAQQTLCFHHFIPSCNMHCQHCALHVDTSFCLQRRPSSPGLMQRSAQMWLSAFKKLMAATQYGMLLSADCTLHDDVPASRDTRRAFLSCLVSCSGTHSLACTACYS